MRRFPIALAAGPGLILGLTFGPAAAFPDRPEPGHTGGFGEPDCTACHFEAAAMSAGETLVLEGLPARYEAGRFYRLVLRLAHPALARGGFELSARFPDGTNAGALASADGRTAVEVSGGIAYARHSALGSEPNASGEAEWRIDWTAPDELRGEVVINVAANVANDDASPLGDRIYLLERRLGPLEE